VFDKQIAFLQQEQDSIVSRLQRLTPDDKFKGADKANRPHATTTTKSNVPTMV